MGKIIIIDGNNLCHRAYHKFKQMRSSEGKQSGVAFGFLYILRSLVNLHSATRVIVVFDGGRHPKRVELLPNYKERDKKDDFDSKSFYSQKDDVKKFLKYFCIDYIEEPGTEADDVMWLLARKLKKKNQIVIVSTDKDFNQLLSKDISIWHPWKDKRITHKNIESIYGYTPEQCVDYLILVGDSSDNIKGYPNIGDKRARDFLAKHSIKEYLYTYEHDEHSIIKRKKLEEIYLLNRQLIDIRLFCRRYMKGNFTTLVKNHKKKIEKKKIAELASDYSITTFHKEDFQKTFKNLL